MQNKSLYKIIKITIDDSNTFRWNPTIEQERKAAIYDILNSNYFYPKDVIDGPYSLNIKLVEWRLILEIGKNSEESLIKSVVISITAIRRIIRDYQIVCETYYEAIKSAPLKRIEAIDVGRRSIHDEGAVSLKDLFQDDIETDLETARRLFTLICVMSLKI